LRGRTAENPQFEPHKKCQTPSERTNEHTDKYQGRQSSIYETAGSLEPTQNDAFSPKTEQKRTTTKN